MKTAVEWLAERCGLEALEDVIAEAKEMEKEQIEDAWDSAYTAEGFFNAEQYYNETFKQQEQ
jgi:hemoglobin-like flavoprotein